MNYGIIKVLTRFYLIFLLCLGAFETVSGKEEAQGEELSSLFPSCPVKFVTDVLAAKDGSLWVVGEGACVYRLEPESGMPGGHGRWLRMDYFPGFPQMEDFRCVAQDLKGCIWVGTDNGGVAVFNGKEWKIYDRKNALPGDCVVDIAVSPVTGEVAVATSGGVAVYDSRERRWDCLNRSNGLYSDQVQSLEFDARGGLWLAYSCGGVGMRTRKEGKFQWTHHQAPWYWDRNQYIRQPENSSGEGLPSNLCNAILSLKNGSIIVGTCNGLAFRSVTGKWTYLRGRDYQDKNRGVYKARTKEGKKKFPANALLSEDYVTTLAETKHGLWVGFREKGAALLDPKTNKVLKCYDGGRNHPIPCSYVTAIAELADGTVLGGTYGGGIVCLEKGAGTWKKLPVAELHDSAFPGEEKIVSLQKIKQGLESCKAVEKSSQSCVYQGEDWSTLGNWCERYGQSYAYLCAINSPSDVVYNPGVFISVRGAMGYHRYPKDSLRRWCHWAGVPEKKNVLFCPEICNRIEAEWDDHGEVYPSSFDGPDIWAKIVLPGGRFLVSLYFYNPNGHQKATAKRDFLIEVRQSSIPRNLNQQVFSAWHYLLPEKEMLDMVSEKVLARARVNYFTRHGVYKNFIMEGGKAYYVRVVRNGSFNTIWNGIFISPVIKAKSYHPVCTKGLIEYAGIYPQKRVLEDSEINILYRELSEAYQRCNDAAMIPNFHQLMLSLFRHAEKEETLHESLLYNLRWDLKIADVRDAEEFEDIMKKSWFALQDKYPLYQSRNWSPYAPRTIPFSVKETRLMKRLGIDWKEYLPGKKSEAEIQAMHDFLEKQNQ